MFRRTDSCFAAVYVVGGRIVGVADALIVDIAAAAGVARVAGVRTVIVPVVCRFFFRGFGSTSQNPRVPRVRQCRPRFGCRHVPLVVGRLGLGGLVDMQT